LRKSKNGEVGGKKRHLRVHGAKPLLVTRSRESWKKRKGGDLKVARRPELCRLTGGNSFEAGKKRYKKREASNDCNGKKTLPVTRERRTGGGGKGPVVYAPLNTPRQKQKKKKKKKKKPGGSNYRSSHGTGNGGTFKNKGAGKGEKKKGPWY